jgi:hypothetical protein
MRLYPIKSHAGMSSATLGGIVSKILPGLHPERFRLSCAVSIAQSRFAKIFGKLNAPCDLRMFQALKRNQRDLSRLEAEELE